MNPQSRSRTFTLGCDPLAILLEESDDSCGGIKGLIGGLGDAIKKEFKPRFPGTTLAHFLEEPIVIGAVRLEVKAQVKQRRVTRSRPMRPLPSRNG